VRSYFIFHISKLYKSISNGYNIGEIIKKKVLETKTYYYLKMLPIEKFMNLKIVQCDGFVLLRTCIAKVYTYSENIVQIVKIVNEHNGHDQPSIHRKIYSNGCKRKAVENL
jgi:hypothetical protein